MAKASEVEALKAEIKRLKGILRSFNEHAIDCDGDNWICGLCGVRQDFAVDLSAFPHEPYCPMAPEE